MSSDVIMAPVSDGPSGLISKKDVLVIYNELDTLNNQMYVVKHYILNLEAFIQTWSLFAAITASNLLGRLSTTFCKIFERFAYLPTRTLARLCSDVEYEGLALCQLSSYGVQKIHSLHSGNVQFILWEFLPHVLPFM